jgi:hypothetical protein
MIQARLRRLAVAFIFPGSYTKVRVSEWPSRAKRTARHPTPTFYGMLMSGEGILRFDRRVSTRLSYWQVRTKRAYLMSDLWNLHCKRPLTATSRTLFGLARSACSVKVFCHRACGARA